jgi:hypothetical protein
MLLRVRESDFQELEPALLAALDGTGEVVPLPKAIF